MTAETSNARGEVVAWEARDPDDGARWVTRHASERDGWMGLGRTIRPLIYGDAPPPAAARGDVRGLVARVSQLREAIESEPDHCFGANVIGGRAYGVRENLLCIVGLIEAALAAEGMQAGEVEQRARELLAQQYDECDPDYAQTVRDGEDLDQDDTIALRAIASALSQQPEPKAEARGVVDEAVPRYVCLKAEGSRYAYVNDTQESRTVKRYDIFRRYGGMDGWTCATEHAASLNALTGERNG